MTQKISISLLYGVVTIAFLAFLYLLGLQTPIAGAAAPGGYRTVVATTSNPTIGTTASVLFASSTCMARVITTYASPVMLTFSDYAAQTPTGTFGHLQTASTTVVYDSGQYGCGLFKVYAFSAATITVSEMRDFR